MPFGSTGMAVAIHQTSERPVAKAIDVTDADRLEAGGRRRPLIGKSDEKWEQRHRATHDSARLANSDLFSIIPPQRRP